MCFALQPYQINTIRWYRKLSFEALESGYDLLQYHNLEEIVQTLRTSVPSFVDWE